MTRTDYISLIRKAGFSVRPVVQARTDGSHRLEITAYAIHAPVTGYVTTMLIWDTDGGLRVFFESTSIRAAEDIAVLKALSAEQVAA